jgi:hypothetical protein
MSVDELFVKGGKVANVRIRKKSRNARRFSIEVSTGADSLYDNLVFQFRVTNTRRQMIPNLNICQTAKKTFPFSPQSSVTPLIANADAATI